MEYYRLKHEEWDETEKKQFSGMVLYVMLKCNKNQRAGIVQIWINTYLLGNGEQNNYVIFGYFYSPQSIGYMATSAGNGNIVGNCDNNLVAPLS